MSIADRLTAALADRYRIDRELGAGGMATVYLAHDLKHERDVAIKVLHPDLGAALGGERFLSEIKTTAKLQHPHILPLLDSGAADGLLYYVMPLVTGETLRTRLERERQLPIEDALRIAREVADALGSAHALGIIHRDIKPENILLQGGHALVADFGIALAVQSAGGARMTQTGLSLGTPQYMSPEQAMGEKVIDLRSDLYALGAVTYEMLVGEAPFTGPSVQAIVARVLTEEPRNIALQRKAVPESVESAVMRALEKLPADRFASAAEFVTALDVGTLATRRAKPGARGGAERSRGLVVAAVTTGAFLLAAGWFVGRRATVTSTAVAMSTSLLLPDSLVLEPFTSNTEGLPTLALSPDGSQLVFVSRAGKQPKLFIRRLADFAVRPLDGTDGATAPFFSPGGDAVAFFSDGLLKRLSLADGRVTTVASGISDPWGGAWLSDGRIVVARRRAFSLLLLTASGDTVRSIDCAPGCSLPEALSDDRSVIVTRRLGTLAVVNVETGEQRGLARWGAKGDKESVRGMSARLDGDGHLLYVGPGAQVFAVPFDARRGEVTGPASVIAEGVRVETGRGAAQFALSRAGVLAYAPGGLMSVGLLVRADRNGKLDTLAAPPASYNAIDLTPDGRRALVLVGTPTGDASLQVVDVQTGKVTTWLTGPAIGWSRWAADGKRVVFSRDSAAFIGDPDLSTPPRALRIDPSIFDLQPLADGTSYRGFIRDTIVIVNEAGGPAQRLATGVPLSAATPDNRWLIGEDTHHEPSSIVALALDASGRRIEIAGGGRFSMVAWASGGHELITCSSHLVRAAIGAPHPIQSFWAVSYDASNTGTPFGEPRHLFDVDAADFPGRNYAVAAAGNLFLFKQQLQVPPLREVRIVSNWHQRLTAGVQP